MRAVLSVVVAVVMGSGVFAWDGAGAKPQAVEREPPAAVVGDLSGYYTCEGKDPNGASYRGVVLVVRAGETYVVTWVMRGGMTFTGVGVRTGDHFAVAWVLPVREQVLRGVNVYRVEPLCKCRPCACKDGCGCGVVMAGRWATLPGNGELQHERLRWLKSIEADN